MNMNTKTVVRAIIIGGIMATIFSIFIIPYFRTPKSTGELQPKTPPTLNKNPTTSPFDKKISNFEK